MLQATEATLTPVLLHHDSPEVHDKDGCSVAWMSLSTLPGTATISATLPASSVPTSASTPEQLRGIARAGEERRGRAHAEIGHEPEFHAHSCHAGYTPASVPNAIGTPMRSAALNMLP